MKALNYILKGKIAVPCDTLEWARWFETADRQVALIYFKNPEPWRTTDFKKAKDDDDYRVKEWGSTPRELVDMQHQVSKIMVSTVFMGIDHNWAGGPPILFETLVVNGPLNEQQDRCSTWEQAEEMHKAMVARVQSALLDSDLYVISEQRQ